MLIFTVYYMIPLISLFCGLIAFVSKRKHLLNALLSLEFIMLNMYWMLSNMFMALGSEMYFMLFFLTLAACEGALGLALLVSVVRSHGSDNFSSLSMLSC